MYIFTFHRNRCIYLHFSHKTPPTHHSRARTRTHREIQRERERGTQTHINLKVSLAREQFAEPTKGAAAKARALCVGACVYVCEREIE